MKTIITLALFALTVTSCSRNNDEPEIVVPAEKTSYNFVYDNSYKVNDIISYKGPLGVKENPKEEVIKDTWNTYSIPEYSQIDVDTKKKMIYFHLGKNILDYQIEFSNDSIYVSTDKRYVGVLDKKNEKLEISKSFYYIKKDLGNSSFSFNRFTKLGITKYKDIFGINSFNSPSEMTKENDKIFWANLSFSYRSS